MSDLTGKRALVTGAARGIGAAIAVELATRGADVAITYQRSADSAATVTDKIRSLGRRAAAIQADSADAAAVTWSIGETVSQIRRIGHLGQQRWCVAFGAAGRDDT